MSDWSPELLKLKGQRDVLRSRAENAEAERDTLRAQLTEARRHVEALVAQWPEGSGPDATRAAREWLKGGG